jgi:Ca2+/H+ antiporter, TMEM165/GDT1 family
MLEAFAVSTGVVALAEIGDKTQLLALVLAARYRQPWPIFWGIFCATLLNHAAAGAVGHWLGPWLSSDTGRWVLAISFFAMAAWALVPDKLDDGEQMVSPHGAFIATLIAFFVVEIGDKTQVATVMLAAKFDALVAVVAGTTLGMMLANAPIVWLGDRMSQKLPLHAIRIAVAIVFAALGAVILFNR